jgi:hypothetical protein
MMIMNKRLATVGFILWCAFLTLLAYGRALTLPLFFDDFVQMPLVDAHSLSDIWRTGGSLAYYRPLSATAWKVIALPFEHHTAFTGHALNLMLHATNGMLVGWLAGLLWARRDRTGIRPRLKWFRIYLSASLFLLYPFSYQAVPWIGAVVHLLVTTLILSSLLTYWLMAQTGRRVWGAVSLLLALLAPFAHENGILVGPLLAAVLITGPDFRRNSRQKIRDILIWTIPALIWLPIWWFAPKQVGGDVTVVNAEALFQNVSYFSQGLAYPLTWLGGRLREWLGMNDMLISALLSTLALGIAALIQYRSRAGRRSLLPWIWWLLASIPSILFLSFDYVINGPRLLMLASVGVAWLWADVAVQAIDWRRSKMTADGKHDRLRLGLVIAIGLIVIGQNFLFLKRRMDLHHLLGEVYKQAISLTTSANEQGQTPVFVNFPGWAAPLETTYALGHEGVQFLPHYAHTESMVSVNTGRAADLDMQINAAIRPIMPYLYGLRASSADWVKLSESERIVYVSDYSPGSVVLRSVGTLAPAATGEIPLVRFEGSQTDIGLLGATASQSRQQVIIEIAWQVKLPPPEHLTVFAHVVDVNGQLIGQIDGDPLGGSYPLSQWTPGQVVLDRRSVDITGAADEILLGIYNRLDGERLDAVATGGTRLANDAFVVKVE